MNLSKKKDVGVSFSKEFSVPEKWLQKNKVFNPTLDIDSALFIDPFLLKNSVHQEFSKCAYDKYIEHFSKIFSLLRAHKEKGDKAWKAALELFKQGETKGLSGTCLGYSKKSIRGRAFGPKLSTKSLIWANEVIELGVTDPELFSSLALFEEGVGADLISDMIAGVTLDCILAFNSRILNKIKLDLNIEIPTSELIIAERKYDLVVNPYSPQGTGIILVASDVLKHLPILDDSRSLKEVADVNTELRNQVNEHIGEIFKIRTKNEKEYIRDTAMKSAEAFQTLLELLKIAEKEPYDTTKDPFGLLEWRTLSERFVQEYSFKIEDNPNKKRIDRIQHVCEKIILQFQKLIEDCRFSQDFYVDGKPRHEHFAQRLFYATAKLYCEANDLDISPESDAGAGPVDFKISNGNDKVVVEVKLSTNSYVVSGFQKQLTAYENAEGAKYGHYIIIDVGKLGGKWQGVKKIYNSDKQFKKMRKIYLIDASLRPSASKLR